MLTELNKLFGTVSGLMFVEYEPAGEPSLILMHFAAEFVKQKANIVYVSLNQSEEMLRISLGKLAIRIDPKLFHFIPWKEIMDMNLNEIEDKILRNIDESLKTLVIFDNALAFRTITSDSTESFQLCQRLRQKLSEESLVILVSPESRTFQGFECISTAYFKLKLVNKGTGQNVTGIVEIEHHPSSFDAIQQNHVYHYLLGERSFKLFLPGATQFLI